MWCKVFRTVWRHLHSAQRQKETVIVKPCQSAELSDGSSSHTLALDEHKTTRSPPGGQRVERSKRRYYLPLLFCFCFWPILVGFFFPWAVFEYEKLTRAKNLLRSLWPFTAAHNQLTFQGFVVFIDFGRAALAVTVAARSPKLQRWKIESWSQSSARLRGAVCYSSGLRWLDSVWLFL